MKAPVDTVLVDEAHGVGVVVPRRLQRFLAATQLLLGVFWLVTSLPVSRSSDVVQVVLGGLFVLLGLLTGYVAVRHDGLWLVVDDRGLRTRTDVSAWTTVRWSAVTAMELEGGRVLKVHAPGGIERRGRVLDQDVHSFRHFGDRPTSTTRLLQYLEHRRARATDDTGP